MNVKPTSQQLISSEDSSVNQTLILPATPFVVHAHELAERYTFDDVLAMRFGIEDGTQLLISGKASQKFLKFAQPLRLTQQDRNYPLSVV